MWLKLLCYSIVLVSAPLLSGLVPVIFYRINWLNSPKIPCQNQTSPPQNTTKCLVVDTFYVGNAEMIRLIFPVTKGISQTIILDSGSSGLWWEEHAVRAEWFINNNAYNLIGILHSHDDLDHIANEQRFKKHWNTRSISPQQEANLWSHLQQISPYKLRIENLNPESQNRISREDNKNSSVLWIDFAEYQLLFTGDISSVQEKKMLPVMQKKRISGSPLFLKAAHHASKTSNSLALLKILQPQTVWASLEVNEKKELAKRDTRITILQNKLAQTNPEACLIRSRPRQVQRFIFCPQKKQIVWTTLAWWQVL